MKNLHCKLKENSIITLRKRLCFIVVGDFQDDDPDMNYIKQRLKNNNTGKILFKGETFKWDEEDDKIYNDRTEFYLNGFLPDIIFSV